jgi:hypothetical protein
MESISKVKAVKDSSVSSRLLAFAGAHPPSVVEALIFVFPENE